MAVKNTSVGIAMSVALLFFFVGYIVWGPVVTKTAMDCLVVGCAVTICMTWFRAAMSAVRHGLWTGADNIVVTVWGTWTIILALFAWVIVFQFFGRPDYLRLSPIPGLFSTLVWMMGVYAILVPVNTGVPLPRPSLRMWVAGVAVGCLVAGSLFTLAVLQVVRLSA